MSKTPADGSQERPGRLKQIRMVAQVLRQADPKALPIVAASAIGTLIILIICKYTTGLRVTAEEEEAGLDSSLHDEVMDH